jgi:hypothetical protein
VQQRAISIGVDFGGGLEWVFGQEDQVVLLAPCLCATGFPFFLKELMKEYASK